MLIDQTKQIGQSSSVSKTGRSEYFFQCDRERWFRLAKTLSDPRRPSFCERSVRSRQQKPSPVDRRDRYRPVRNRRRGYRENSVGVLVRPVGQELRLQVGFVGRLGRKQHQPRPLNRFENDLLRSTIVDQRAGRWRKAELAASLNVRIRRVVLRIPQINLWQCVRECTWKADGHLRCLVTIRHCPKPSGVCPTEAEPLEFGFSPATLQRAASSAAAIGLVTQRRSTL